MLKMNVIAAVTIALLITVGIIQHKVIEVQNDDIEYYKTIGQVDIERQKKMTYDVFEIGINIGQRFANDTARIRIELERQKKEIDVVYFNY